MPEAGVSKIVGVKMNESQERRVQARQAEVAVA
jgi:hypothetical protein